MYIRNRYIICIQKDAGNLSPPYMYPLSPSTHNAFRTHSHTTQNTPILLWKQVHIASLLASPVAGVRRHQDFHSMKAVLPTPPHEESNQEYIDGDHFKEVIGLQTFLKISIYIVY